MNRIHKLLLVSLVLILFAFPRLSHAAEGAMSLYLPGFGGPMAGFLPPPGVYFSNYFYFYNANVGRRTESNSIQLNVNLDFVADFMQMTYVTKYKIFGASWGMTALFPIIGYGNLSAQLVTGAGNVQRSTSNTGIGDIFISPLILGWHTGNFHFLATLGAYFPTGKYSTSDIVNIGKNRFGIETDFGFTYYNFQKKGPLISAYAGFTFDFENPDTNYKSGHEFHLDFSGMYVWSFGFGAGLNGYFLQQITGDSGSGALLGSFKGRVIALGPVITYDVPMSKKFILSLGAKYYREFHATNRFKGNAFFFTTGFKF